MRTRPVDLPTDRGPLFAFFEQLGEELSENKHAFVARGDGRPGVGIVAESGGTLTGYAALAPAREGEWAMELLAEPAAVHALMEAALSAVRDLGATRLRWWVYDPDANRLPIAHGFEPERELLVMGRSLPAPEVPEWDSFSVAGFRPGADEQAWLEVNNAAFAGHPETGDMTLEDLRRRMELDWFDPEGIRLAWEGQRLAGFCWTKVHGPGEGEIYIIGVHPDFQGRGLGAALVGEGMRHLAAAGCERVFLYTEGDNRAAIGMYERLGFEVERTHRSFIRVLEG